MANDVAVSYPQQPTREFSRDPHRVGVRAPSGCRCQACLFAVMVREVRDAGELRQAREALILRSGELLDTPWAALTRPFEPGNIGFVARTDPRLKGVNRLEEQVRQGPAWEVQRTGRITMSPDLAAETRWPTYTGAVIADGSFASVLAVPLAAGAEFLGALVLYSTERDHFTGERLHRAMLLVDHGSAALASVSCRLRAANLEIALRTNREIGTAVGIVMDRLRLTDSQSFDYLREFSQRAHVKLSDLAARIVMTGELPAAR